MKLSVCLSVHMGPCSIGTWVPNAHDKNDLKWFFNIFTVFATNPTNWSECYG